MPAYPKYYRRLRAIRPEILNEWEDDLPGFFEKVRATITDPETLDALGAVQDWVKETMGEIRRMAGRRIVMSSELKKATNRLKELGEW